MVNKSLGQHWLKDRSVLQQIASLAELGDDDTVVEVGPGQGSLTSVLLAQAGRVVAVEFDGQLAAKLPGQFPGKNLQVVNQDILSFELARLPTGYKVVANLPYYITAKTIQKLCESANPPAQATLLLQKEVAERLAAEPGQMSLLALSAQIYNQVDLGPMVSAEYFTPPPEVDSQVVTLKRRSQPLVDDPHKKRFFQLAKAGFSAKRKKLRSSLSGGLGLPKQQVEQMLAEASTPPDRRAQDLSIDDWSKLASIDV